MASMKDIAKYCDVSVATVSKALNGQPDVGEETRARICAAAERLGYYPNSAARALKTNRTYNIGVLFDDDTHVGLTHEYFSHVLNALKNEAEARGYDVTFISKRLDTYRMSYLEHCRYRNVDGVAIANVDFTDPAVLELVGSDIPLVTIDYTFDGHSAVISDNVQAMDQLTEYVIGCGHKKIAFICGESTAVTRSRKAAFHRACRRHGLEIPDAYLISGIYHDPKTSGLATRELLALKEPPTCILYPDDISLLGGMTEIERHGLRIPDDISIVGFDGIPLSRVLRPSLTTLCQDSETLGTRAAQLLVEAIEEPKLFVPRVVTVPGWVQPGQTVKKLS